MKTKFLLPILLVLQCCKAQPIAQTAKNEAGQTLLWEITGKDLQKPSYLFGTFHMMCKDDIRFSDNLLTAFNNSKEVYFEMDLDDVSNTLGAMMYMNMKDGKTLKDLYTEIEYSKLQSFFKDSLKTNIVMFQKMKPSFLEAFLYPKMLSCKNMSGVEQELLKLAGKENKEVRGFETIAFQASVFDSIPYEKQAKSLLTTIDSLDNYKVFFDKMVKVYLSQQLSGIEAMFNDDQFGMKDGLEMLLDKRNQNWVAQLKTILPKTNIFMAVGAGHLVGKEGLIALLRKEGYTVKPMVNY
ncbi:MAG: TraB/GumN family protein [Chitinophagaceae bacterium]|nr:MAG: TraB/GumN family protein [Chitinophagaceae bacterium]